MLRINKNVFYILTAAMLAVSCEKEIDLEPTDYIQEENAYLNMTDLQRGANGMYGYYLNKANSVILSALMSDEIKLGRDNSGQGRFTYTYTFGSDATSGGDLHELWYGMPRVIGQANIVLQNADKVTAADAFEESRRTIIKAQAIGMRALASFDMLEAYAKRYDPADPLGLPYPTEPVELGKPARLTVAATVQAIETDLASARSLLPSVTATAATFTDTTLNAINIAAIQARVALWKRDWAKAKDFATEVINAGVKTVAAPGAAFSGIWTDANTNEILFRIRQSTPGATTVGNLYTSGNLVYYEPSDKIVNSYGPTDIRFGTYFNTAIIGVGAPIRYISKFFTSNKGRGVVDLKVIRISEMYLIRAEAYAELNDFTNAAADLNFLRSRRIGGYVPETFTDKQVLIDAILNERYKELAFEGFRFFDLKRRNLPVQRLLSDTDGNTAWQTLPAGNFRFVFPIPLTETLANPNIPQNPGYN